MSQGRLGVVVKMLSWVADHGMCNPSVVILVRAAIALLDLEHLKKLTPYRLNAHWQPPPELIAMLKEAEASSGLAILRKP